MTTRRSGVTLVEVLVAIFVMGIGLIALLTLFPIGILRMAQAIREARSTQCGNNGARIAVIQSLHLDADVVTDGTFPDLFVNPGIVDVNGAPIWNADPYSESYPIFVDPVGFYAVPTPDWVGNYPALLRRRPAEFTRRGLNLAVPADFAAMQRNIRRSFMLQDEFNFEPTMDDPNVPPGTPQKIGNVVLRGERNFSWAYMLRRPRAGDPSIVDRAVVVFENRPIALTQNQTLQEYVYPGMAFFNDTNNTITVEYTSPTVVAPPVRPGDWILDATRYQTSPTNGSGSAFFYKVVGAEDYVVAQAAPNPPRRFVRFEVANPIRGLYRRYPDVPNYPAVVDPLGSGATVYQGTMIFMEGVVAVFERGPARTP
ncbi:MAG: prepilin-type N-terminal cleavage/methylation domain-containing protein [Planctomycetes bacterium]|jgi:hypothetical protein|nr:prepilin-type N-terminal cleavage/methylation domain-containing protein [Planctomycetota bacterium]